jgi:HAMP domain-containing protein
MVKTPRERSDTLQAVLASASRLQEMVPDAVLVGGAAAALYAGHRDSFDHDHVLTDLAGRYAEVLEAIEVSDGWATSVRATRAPMTILGSLDGVEAGLRQLRRVRPLETIAMEIAAGQSVIVPTHEEILRIKAYLIVQRNYVRDYLDVVALTQSLEPDQAARILRPIDDYYADRSGEAGSVLTALVKALADPQPRDEQVTQQLSSYKGLDQRWHDWSTVTAACRQLALQLADAD